MLERVVKDDQVIILPDTYVMTLWRNIVSMLYMHPTLLVHPDMNDFREVFIENNVIHESETTEIFINIPTPERRTSWLRPQITYPLVALQAIFGHIVDWTLCENGIIVNSYTLCSEIKSAATELAEFIRTYPKALYEEEYGFIYDFLVRFGIPPKTIEALIETSIPIAIGTSPTSTTTETVTSTLNESPKEDINANRKLQQTQGVVQLKRKSSISQTQLKNKLASTNQPRRKSSTMLEKIRSESLSQRKRKASFEESFRTRKQSGSLLQRPEESKNSILASVGKSEEMKSVDVKKCTVGLDKLLVQDSKTEIEPPSSSIVEQEDTKSSILIDKPSPVDSKPESLLNGSQGHSEFSVTESPTKREKKFIHSTTPKPKLNSGSKVKVSSVKTRETPLTSSPPPASKAKSSVVVVQDAQQKKIPTSPKFCEGLNLSKYKLQRVSIDLYDCRQDPDICKKYFKGKPSVKIPVPKNKPRLQTQPIKKKPQKVIESRNNILVRKRKRITSQSSSSDYLDLSGVDSDFTDSNDEYCSLNKPSDVSHRLHFYQKIKSKEFVSSSSSSSSSSSHYEFESRNPKSITDSSSLFSSSDSSSLTSDSEDDFSEDFSRKGGKTKYNGQLGINNYKDDNDKTKNVKLTQKKPFEEKLMPLRGRGKPSGNVAERSRDMNIVTTSTNLTSRNKRGSDERVVVVPLKKQNNLSKIQPKISLEQSIKTFKVSVETTNPSVTQADVRQTKTQQGKPPVRHVIQSIRIQRQPSISRVKVFMRSSDSDSESSTSETQEDVTSSIPVAPVVDSIAAELPGDLGIDCSKEFVQRLLLTIHQVEETNHTPLTTCSSLDLPLHNDSSQSSGEEEEHSSTSSTNKKNIITSPSTSTNDTPKVIVQPVNSSVQIPPVFSFMRNKAKTPSPSSPPSSPSNALL